MDPTRNPDVRPSPVEVKGLHKAFGGQVVLNGIDLEVAANQIVAVMGKSGAGKSVLLKLLVGLEPPDAGEVRLCGQNIANLTHDQLNDVRKKVGFLFQQAALYDSLSLLENVEFPLARHTKLAATERTEKARHLLADVGLESDLDKLPSEISGGMQKRVGLARALALDPELLLLDEPTAGLDPITSAGIGKLISDLRTSRKIASLVVTHDVPGAKVFVDRFVLLNEGNIVAGGSFDEIRRSSDDFVSQFIAGVG